MAACARILENRPENALAIVGAIRSFWNRRGYLSEASKWIKQALEKNGEDSDPKLLAKAYLALGDSTWGQGDSTTADWAYQESLRFARQINDKYWISTALRGLGYIKRVQGNLAEAKHLIEESLELARELNDNRLISLRLNSLGEIARTDRDLPVNIVGIVILLCMVPVGWLLAHFITAGGVLGALTLPLVGAGILFVLVAGLIAAAVCGYMAGLIGSTNSPVSGLGILTVLSASLLVGIIGPGLTGPNEQQALIAFILFVTTIVMAVAVMGNDNLQDLKTRQLVGATPWNQQVALVIGVLAGSIVIPPVLDLLNQAYGFPDDPNRVAITDQPLNAPQATLIATLAKGVIGGDLDWGPLGIGGLIGAGLIIADMIIKGGSKGKLTLPPLGVSLAIYLPSAVTAPVIVGAVAGWLYDRSVGKLSWGEIAKRLGILVASGYIVGESLFNVLHALLIVVTRKDAPLAFMPAVEEHAGTIIAFVMATVIVVGLYLWAAGQAKKVEAES